MFLRVKIQNLIRCLGCERERPLDVIQFRALDACNLGALTDVGMQTGQGSALQF
ncbi:hypothetical protein D3C85_1678230 [compost metagenome]